MKRGFAYLLVATILALVAVLVFVPGEHAVENSAADTLLIPGLADRINDVDRVDIDVWHSADIDHALVNAVICLRDRDVQPPCIRIDREPSKS